METILEKVRARIIEMVPEIKELKFGCKVKAQIWNKAAKLTWRDGILIDPVGSIHNLSHYPYVRFANHSDYVYHDMKILGRPITLEDVLVAMDGAEPVAGMDWTLFGPVNNKLGFEVEDLNKVFDWQLNKPLDQQSEETVAFIGKILGVLDI